MFWFLMCCWQIGSDWCYLLRSWDLHDVPSGHVVLEKKGQLSAPTTWPTSSRQLQAPPTAPTVAPASTRQLQSSPCAPTALLESTPGQQARLPSASAGTALLERTPRHQEPRSARTVLLEITHRQKDQQRVSTAEQGRTSMSQGLLHARHVGRIPVLFLEPLRPSAAPPKRTRCVQSTCTMSLQFGRLSLHVYRRLSCF